MSAVFARHVAAWRAAIEALPGVGPDVLGGYPTSKRVTADAAVGLLLAGETVDAVIDEFGLGMDEADLWRAAFWTLAVERDLRRRHVPIREWGVEVGRVWEPVSPARPTPTAPAAAGTSRPAPGATTR